ncbi:hypothetical protein Taro_008646 [Colocasia esculenta]|uniref:PHD finger family protein n=1 Tax=Colocasia esculenta TaxID=4460 RepID=A0A843U2V7_COLES|nr:hypothetical protein [Colocasia esculenta]
MSGGRCHRRKMMGRGAEGGCGAEEWPCPISRASSHAAASTASREVGVGHYVQARKALSERSPFEEEEVLARVATLPVGLAAALSRSSDGRRKHRKAHAEHAKKDPLAQPAPAVWSVWSETEEYFRPITLADIDKLEHKLPVLSGSALDPCLTIPLLRGEESQSTVVTAVAEGCRSLAEASVAVNGTEGIFEAVMNDGVLVNPQQREEELGQPQQTMEIVQPHQQKGQQEEDDRGQQAMEIDQVTIDGAACCPPAEKDENLVDYSSMNWILCSRNRALLASERPNKKRKLLGSDAGLERLLLLPHLQGEDSVLCDYCSLGNYDGVSNRFLHCASCKVSVHMKCYGVRDAPEGTWLCSWCRQSEVAGSHGDKVGPGPCLLCPKGVGALKPVEADNSQSGSSMKFAHLFCSLWMPEVYIDNIETMEPIRNVEKVQETRKRLVCNVCKVKQGACIRCSHGTCRTSFHPVCAKEARQRMEIWGKRKSDDVELRAFCSKHSTFQDVGLMQLRKDPTKLASDHSSVNNALPATTLAARIPKIRITRKEVDKSTGEENAASSCFVSVSGNEIPLDQEKPEVRVRPGSNGALLSQNMLIDGESCHVMENSASDMNDLSTSLKKLFDCGKIDVADVALKMQVPSDSLELALAGDTSSLSYELKLKIIKWLQDYVHLGCPVRHLNSTSGCTLSSSPKDDSDEDTNGTKVTGLSALDAVLVKSLLPQRRTKSNIRILKDNKVVCASGETFPDGYFNGKPVNEFVEDKSGEDEVACSGPLFHDQDYGDKEQNVLKKVMLS